MRDLLQAFILQNLSDMHKRKKMAYTSMVKTTRGGAVWKLVGLITRRSQVQILSPLLNAQIAPRNFYLQFHTVSLKIESYLSNREAFSDSLKLRSSRCVILLTALAVSSKITLLAKS